MACQHIAGWTNRRGIFGSGTGIGRLAGAALDVLTTEPPPLSHPLIGVKNCLITPHVAWATREARERLLETAITNLRVWIEGKPRNVVNSAVLMTEKL